MTAKLFFQAITKFVMDVLTVGVLMFASAGSLVLSDGWLFMGILFIPMFIGGLVMMTKNTELLRKRLDVREQQGQQFMVVTLSAVMLIAVFVVAGLNFRFSWRVMPFGVAIADAVVFLIASALYFEVLRENTYLSRTIEIQENQRVVDTELYGIVRHSM